MNNDEQTSSTLEISSTDEVRRVPVISQLIVLAVVLFLLLGTHFSSALMQERTVSTTTQSAAVQQALAEPDSTVETEPNPYTNIAVLGEAALVWDVTEQRLLYAKNPDEQLPLASVTKLMTALLANELLTPTTTIQISRAALNQDGTSGLSEGEEFTLENISDLLLLTSSNDGAYAVAEALGSRFSDTDPVASFVALMNIRSEELGLTQTYFRNPTGLDISQTEAGAYGSARDMLFLMQHLLHTQSDALRATADTTETITNQAGYRHQAQNTNQYVNDIPGIIGSKTGFTELAGGNLVIAYDAGVNRPIIVVVLGSSWQGRFDDVRTLIDATSNYLK